MSAGEKLKALDESAQGPQTFGPEPQEWQTAAETVMVALPQIVAVVEAAEKEHSFTHPGGKQQMMDWSWKPCPVCSALAALDEALQ